MSEEIKRCKECGSRLVGDLYQTGLEVNFMSSGMLLPTDPPMNRHITIPRETVHRRNNSYLQMAEFAAWVCGVKIEELSRGVMVDFMFNEMARRDEKK